MKGTELTFQCCGHSFTITGIETGVHTDHCLHCDTANPSVERETVKL